MARSTWLGITVAVLCAACGGSGGGGSGVSAGPLYWGVPFVASGAATTMVVGLRNVDSQGTTATLQGYRPDGTPYTGPVSVNLGGTSEERLSVSEALGGDTPAGGWILASTPTGAVEVYFAVVIPVLTAEETSRAYALDDLAVPLTSYEDGVDVTNRTTSIQISNASGAATTITVTPYAEPLNPLDPPVAGTPQALPFAAYETQTFTPDALAGTLLFRGSFFLSAATPFVAAGEEDLAYAVSRKSSNGRNVSAGLSFGRDPLPVATSYLDFAMVVRNDADVTRILTITQIVSANATTILPAPRNVTLAPHEERVIGTLDAPFDDIFGDITTFGSFVRFRIEMQVPSEIDVSFRQFDPDFLDYNMTVVPSPTGHVFDVSDVLPQLTLTTGLRTFSSILNRSNAEITVYAEALITQPPGFDGVASPITTLTVPANSRLDFSPDGVLYRDRDNVVTPVIGLRFRSGASFSVTGWRERRSIVTTRLVSLSPLEVRSFDDGE